MASRSTSTTYTKQNVNTQQATAVAPTAVSAVTVTDTFLTIDNPSTPEFE